MSCMGGLLGHFLWGISSVAAVPCPCTICSCGRSLLWWCIVFPSHKFCTLILKLDDQLKLTAYFTLEKRWILFCVSWLCHNGYRNKKKCKLVNDGTNPSHTVDFTKGKRHASNSISDLPAGGILWKVFVTGQQCCKATKCSSCLCWEQKENKKGA